jgi:hypothetical protein
MRQRRRPLRLTDLTEEVLTVTNALGAILIVWNAFEKCGEVLEW